MPPKLRHSSPKIFGLTTTVRSGKRANRSSKNVLLYIKDAFADHLEQNFTQKSHLLSKEEVQEYKNQIIAIKFKENSTGVVQLANSLLNTASIIMSNWERVDKSDTSGSETEMSGYEMDEDAPELMRKNARKSPILQEDVQKDKTKLKDIDTGEETQMDQDTENYLIDSQKIYGFKKVENFKGFTQEEIAAGGSKAQQESVLIISMESTENLEVPRFTEEERRDEEDNSDVIRVTLPQMEFTESDNFDSLDRCQSLPVVYEDWRKNSSQSRKDISTCISGTISDETEMDLDNDICPMADAILARTETVRFSQEMNAEFPFPETSSQEANAFTVKNQQTPERVIEIGIENEEIVSEEKRIHAMETSVNETVYEFENLQMPPVETIASTDVLQPPPVTKQNQEKSVSSQSTRPTEMNSKETNMELEEDIRPIDKTVLPSTETVSFPFPELEPQERINSATNEQQTNETGAEKQEMSNKEKRIRMMKKYLNETVYDFANVQMPPPEIQRCFMESYKEWSREFYTQVVEASTVEVPDLSEAAAEAGKYKKENINLFEEIPEDYFATVVPIPTNETEERAPSVSGNWSLGSVESNGSEWIKKENVDSTNDVENICQEIMSFMNIYDIINK